MRPKHFKCPVCKGTGFDRKSKDHAFHTCHDCGGDGKLSPREYKIVKMKIDFKSGKKMAFV